MTLDRTGRAIGPRCSAGCRNGWLTGPDSDAPQLCPHCRALPQRDVHDHAERIPSPRAQAAIQAAGRKDPHV